MGERTFDIGQVMDSVSQEDVMEKEDEFERCLASDVPCYYKTMQKEEFGVVNFSFFNAEKYPFQSIVAFGFLSTPLYSSSRERNFSAVGGILTPPRSFTDSGTVFDQF